MSKFLSTVLLVSLTVPAFAAHQSSRVIYGHDNRHEIYQETNPDIVTVSNSVAIMVPTVNFSYGDNSQVDMVTDTLKDTFGVCESEPYGNQPNPGYCTGFLVGDDLLATAGHCITSEEDCAGNIWVFDFNAKEDGTAETSMSSDHVYKCKEIIKREQVGEEDGDTLGQDYTLIRLDRKVTDRAPLKLRTDKQLKMGDEVMVIGHPLGLPKKISGGANVRTILDQYFVANLDTYGGNSGSPVFNTKTLEVEGILVRGEQDFNWDEQNMCAYSNVCASDDCRGEDSTDIHYIVDAINELNVMSPVAAH